MLKRTYSYQYLISNTYFKKIMQNLDKSVSKNKLPYQNAKILLESIKEQIMSTTSQQQHTHVKIDTPQYQQLLKIFKLYNQISNTLRKGTLPKQENIEIVSSLTSSNLVKKPSESISSKASDLGEVMMILKKLASSDNKNVLQEVDKSQINSSQKEQLLSIIKTLKGRLDSGSSHLSIYDVLDNLSQPYAKRKDLSSWFDEKTGNIYRSLSMMKKAVDDSIDQLQNAKQISPKQNSINPIFWSQSLYVPITNLIKFKNDPTANNLKSIPALKRTVSDNNEAPHQELQTKLKNAQIQIDKLKTKSKDIFELCGKELMKFHNKAKHEYECKTCVAIKMEDEGKNYLEMTERIIQQQFSQLFDFFRAVYQDRGNQDLQKELNQYRITQKLEKAANLVLLEMKNNENLRLLNEEMTKNKSLSDQLQLLKESLQNDRKELQLLRTQRQQKNEKTQTLKQQIGTVIAKIANLQQNANSNTNIDNNMCVDESPQILKRQEQIKRLKSQLQQSKEQNNQLKNQIDEMLLDKKTSAERNLQQTEQKDKSQQQSEQKIEEMSLSLKKLTEDNKGKEDVIKRLGQQLQKFKDQNEKVKQSNIAHENTVQSLNAHIKRLETNIQSHLLKIQTLEGEIGNLNQTIATKQDNQSKTHQDQIAKLQSEIEKLKRESSSQLANEKSKGNQLQRQKLVLNINFESLKTHQAIFQTNSIAKEKEHLKRIEELTKQKESKQAQIRDMILEFKTNQTNLSQNLNNSSQKQKRMNEKAQLRQNEWKEKQQSFEREIQSKNNEINNKQQQIATNIQIIRALTADLNESNSKIKELYINLGSSEELNRTNSEQKKQIIKDYQLLLESNRIIADQLRNAEKEAKKLTEKIADLQDKHRQLMNQNAELGVFRLSLQQKQKQLQVTSQKLQQCRKRLNELSIQNQHLLSMHKQPKASRIGSHYVTLSKLHDIDIEEVAHIDKNFNFDILADQFDKKKNLIKHIEDLKKDQLVKSKILFRFDQLNPTSFHKYIDNRANLLCLVKTRRGALIATFYSGVYSKGDPLLQPSLLISLNNNLCFDLHNVLTSNSGRQFRGMTYDDFFLIFGNAELRIRANERIIFSNFGISNSFFNNRGHRVNDILMEGDTREVELQTYEIYELTFNKTENMEEIN